MVKVDFNIIVPIGSGTEGVEVAERQMIEKIVRLTSDLSAIDGAPLVAFDKISYNPTANQFECPISLRLPWYNSARPLLTVAKKYDLAASQYSKKQRLPYQGSPDDFSEAVFVDFRDACEPQIGYNRDGMAYIKNAIGTHEAHFPGPIFKKDKITEWYVVGKNGKQGFYNKNGQVVIPSIYDAVGEFTISGLCPVKCGEKYGVIDKEDNPVISFCFEHLEALYDDDERLGKNSLYIGKVDGKFGVIDKDGSVAIPFEYDYLGRNVPRGYRSEDIKELQDGYLVACKDRMIGIVDVNHEIAVPIARDINDLSSMKYPEIRFGASVDRKVNAQELKLQSLIKQYAFVASLKPSKESLEELWHELDGMRRVTYENFDDPKVLKEWWEQNRQSNLREIKGNIEDISATVLELGSNATNEDMSYPAQVHLLDVPPMDESIFLCERRSGLYISPEQKVDNMEMDIIDAAVGIDIERHMYPYGFSSEFEEQQVEMQINEMMESLKELQKKQSEMKLDIHKYKYSEPDRHAELKFALEFAISARQEVSDSRWENSPYSHDLDSGPEDFEYYKQRECDRIDKEIEVLQQMLSDHCPNEKKHLCEPSKLLRGVENNIRQESAWAKLVREDNLIKQEHKL